MKEAKQIAAKKKVIPFEGFTCPTTNYIKLPNSWLEEVYARVRSLAETKILLYVARHTWGYQEYDSAKAITIDEFMHGRKRRDGTRMDGGTGLSKQTITNGIKKVIAHGYLVCETDETDRARIKKSYALRMRPDLSSAETGQADRPDEHVQPEVLASGTDVEEADRWGQENKPLQSSIQTTDAEEIAIRGLNRRRRSEKDTLEKHQKKNTGERYQGEQAFAHTQANVQTSSQNNKDGNLLSEQKEVQAFFDVFDKLWQEVTGEPAARYARNKEATEHINMLLQENQHNPTFVTPEKLRAVYLHLWNQPRDTRTGFFWQEHMTLKAICKNYGSQIMALNAQNKTSAALDDDPYTLKNLFARTAQGEQI